MARGLVHAVELEHSVRVHAELRCEWLSASYSIVEELTIFFCPLRP